MIKIQGNLDNFIFNSCSRKKKIPTESDAITKAMKYGIDYYFCDICGYYHLTSHKMKKEV